MSKVQVRGYKRAKPAKKTKGYAQGGLMPESFNQIPSTAPELLSSAGAQRSSPAEYLQSAAESFNAEQDWRKGHMLTGMQKERVAEDRGQLQDAGKYLGMDVGLGTRQPYQDSGPGGAPPPAPVPEYQPYQMGFQKKQRRPPSGLGVPSLLGMQRGGTIDYRQGGPVAGGPPGRDTVPVVAPQGGPTQAMLDNGEYVLPRPTVQAVGKPALDGLVVGTTGQPPVGYGQPPPAPTGYGCGGKMKYGKGGQIEPGNIDLTKRPVVKNPDGSISTVRTMGIEQDGRHINIPTVSPDGRIMSNREALGLYDEFGKHLGAYDSRDAAGAAAQSLHADQQRMYAPTQDYAQGGLLDRFRNRGQQIDAQVNQAVQGPPPVPQQPQQAQPMPPTETEKPRGLADIMREIRAKNPPVQGYQQGGKVQGYRVGGLTDEELMAQSPPYAKGPQVMTDTGYSVDAMGRGRQPLPMNEDSRFIPTADTVGSKSNRTWGQARNENDAAVAQAVADQLRPPAAPQQVGGIAGANMQRGTQAPSATPDYRAPRAPARPTATQPAAVASPTSQPAAGATSTAERTQILPSIAEGVNQLEMAKVAKQIPSEIADAYKREGLYGAIGEGGRGLAAMVPATYVDVSRGITGLVSGATAAPAQVLEKTVTGKIAAPPPPQAAAPAATQAQPGAAVPPPPPFGQREVGTVYTPPKELQADVGKLVGENQGQSATELAFGVGTPAHRPPGAPTASQLKRSPLGLTPDALNPTGGGYVGTVGGAPHGVSDADYAKMSLADKSAAKVKSMEDATKAIRSARNARREAEGSPPVGGWKRYLLDQQQAAQVNELNQDLLKKVYDTRLGIVADTAKAQTAAQLSQPNDLMNGIANIVPEDPDGWLRGLAAQAALQKADRPLAEQIQFGSKVALTLGTRDQLREKAIAALKADGRWKDPSEPEIEATMQKMIEDAMIVAPKK